MTAAIPPDPNRGPRVDWRCRSRTEHGHRCRFRTHHAGPCRAFGLSWWGVPKGVRRATRRKAAAS